MSRQELGKLGENFLNQILIEAGLASKLVPIGSGGDMVVSGLMVEIKTTVLREGYASFCADKSGHTNCKNSQWVVVLVIEGEEIAHYYLIPSGEITGKTVKINPYGNGKYNQFLTNLQTIVQTFAE
jgi:hypothetical protein